MTDNVNRAGVNFTIQGVYVTMLTYIKYSFVRKYKHMKGRNDKCELRYSQQIVYVGM